MIYFAAIDAKPPADGGAHIHYFAAPNDALMAKVELALCNRLSRPITLTFLTPAEVPMTAGRVTELNRVEVC